MLSCAACNRLPSALQQMPPYWRHRAGRFAGLLRDHLGVSEATLARDVFPGGTLVVPRAGLVHSGPAA